MIIRNGVNIYPNLFIEYWQNYLVRGSRLIDFGNRSSIAGNAFQINAGYGILQGSRFLRHNNNGRVVL